LMTVAFPLPFNLDRVDLVSLTFCVVLVVQRDSSHPRDVDGSGAGTLSLAGHWYTTGTLSMRRPKPADGFWRISDKLCRMLMRRLFAHAKSTTFNSPFLT
jgi:hypothetical protein